MSVTSLSGGLIDAPVSGIMGLAFQQLAQTRALPFWQAITDNNLLTSPEFSIWIGRDQKPPSETALVADGVFTLGGTNSSLFSGNVEFTNVVTDPGVSATFWQIPLSSKYSV